MKRLIILLLLTTNVAFAEYRYDGEYLKLDTPATKTIEYVEQLESQLYDGDIKDNFPKFYAQLQKQKYILLDQAKDSFVTEKQPNTLALEDIHLYYITLNEWDIVDINNKYLRKYSKDLPIVWQDYLKIQEQRMSQYEIDALLSPEDIAYDLNTMRYFIDKYPRFRYTKQVRNHLYFITCVFIKNMYYGYAEQMPDYSKKRFQEVLKLVNKDTLEYKTLLETYQIAERHKFKACDEYYEPLLKNYPNKKVCRWLAIPVKRLGIF